MWQINNYLIWKSIDLSNFKTQDLKHRNVISKYKYQIRKYNFFIVAVMYLYLQWTSMPLRQVYTKQQRTHL
jgi:hypothetical protein